MTGGTVISEDLGLKLENVSLETLGRTKKVMIDKANTTIVGGAGKRASIEARIAEIKISLRKPPPITTARSSRNGWRGSPAVSL